MQTDALDLAIETIPYFRCLRLDERAQVAELMHTRRLEFGASMETTPDGSVILIVLQGSVTLARQGIDTLYLGEGDWTDDLRAICSRGYSGVLTAQTESWVALLDKAALDQLFMKIPIIAVSLVAELGREIARRNDLMREAMLARSSGLPPAAFRALVGGRRQRMRRRLHVSLGRIGSLLWRALVVEPSRRLTFWIFVGVVVSLVCARTVVAMIIDHGLQSRLFALVEDATGNPIHVHHFNYGLIIVSLVGLASFSQMRKALRRLSFAFGVGVGLVADEFALLWNLNPDYYQPSSRLAAALVLFGLFQVVYFRSLYLAIARRVFAWLQP